MPGVQTDPVARARPRSPPGNLPVELSSFVGRARELSDVKRLLQDAHAITVTGPGGIGKNRLALRGGRRLAALPGRRLALRAGRAGEARSWRPTHSPTRCGCRA